MARIKTVLRRVNGKDRDKSLQVFDLKLDPTSHRVTIEDRLVEMGPTEFRLLKFFMQNQEKVFSRDHIQTSVWGANVYLEERTIDVHIRRLRKALSSIRQNLHRLLQTHPNRPQRRLPLLRPPRLTQPPRRTPTTSPFPPKPPILTVIPPEAPLHTVIPPEAPFHTVILREAKRSRRISHLQQHLAAHPVLPKSKKTQIFAKNAIKTFIFSPKFL